MSGSNGGLPGQGHIQAVVESLEQARQAITQMPAALRNDIQNLYNKAKNWNESRKLRKFFKDSRERQTQLENELKQQREELHRLRQAQGQGQNNPSGPSGPASPTPNGGGPQPPAGPNTSGFTAINRRPQPPRVAYSQGLNTTTPALPAPTPAALPAPALNGQVIPPPNSKVGQKSSFAQEFEKQQTAQQKNAATRLLHRTEKENDARWNKKDDDDSILALLLGRHDDKAAASPLAKKHKHHLFKWLREFKLFKLLRKGLRKLATLPERLAKRLKSILKLEKLKKVARDGVIAAESGTAALEAGKVTETAAKTVKAETAITDAAKVTETAATATASKVVNSADKVVETAETATKAAKLVTSGADAEKVFKLTQGLTRIMNVSKAFRGAGLAGLVVSDIAIPTALATAVAATAPASESPEVTQQKALSTFKNTESDAETRQLAYDGSKALEKGNYADAASKFASTAWQKIGGPGIVEVYKLWRDHPAEALAAAKVGTQTIIDLAKDVPELATWAKEHPDQFREAVQTVGADKNVANATRDALASGTDLQTAATNVATVSAQNPEIVSSALKVHDSLTSATVLPTPAANQSVASSVPALPAPRRTGRRADPRNEQMSIPATAVTTAARPTKPSAAASTPTYSAG